MKKIILFALTFTALQANAVMVAPTPATTDPSSPAYTPANSQDYAAPNQNLNQAAQQAPTGMNRAYAPAGMGAGAAGTAANPAGASGNPGSADPRSPTYSQDNANAHTSPTYSQDNAAANDARSQAIQQQETSGPQPSVPVDAAKR